MDQALSFTQGLDSALVFRQLHPPTPETSLIDDVSLGLIEAAVRQQRIVQIFVCGHACCSLFPEPTDQQNLRGQSAYEKLLQRTCQREDSNRQGQRQLLERLRELQQSPYLASELSQKCLTIHGLFYLPESGVMTVFNEEAGQFVPADI